VFSSLASNDYTVVVTNSAFLKGGDWNLAAAETRGLSDGNRDWAVYGYQHNGNIRWEIPVTAMTETIWAMQANATAGLYTKMNVSACYAEYDDYWSPVGNVVIVAKNQSVQNQPNDTLLLYASVKPRYDDWEKNQWGFRSLSPYETRRWWSQPPSQPVQNWYLSPKLYEVDYCLVQPPATTAGRCRFEFSPGIMATICIINFIKCGVIISVWVTRRRQAKRGQQEAILCTLGDAIASFMRTPDATTTNMCLATKDDFRRKWSIKGRVRASMPSREPRAWKDSRTFWASSAGIGWWISLLFA
jgi:hypothetical protein